jgi:hypothetical protein
MKSKTTGLWFVVAVLLAAGIWIFENYFQPAAPDEKLLFGGLQPGRIVSLQITPGGAREITIVHTNKSWLMQTPFVYPAQATVVESLLGTLAKLTPAAALTPAEMSHRKDAEAEFGFDNPQFRLDLADDDQNWHVVVGNKTAPGDGVYVRMVGAAGAFVTDTSWLQFLPRDAGDWRDTTLVDVPALTDWIVITNGAKTLEFRRDVTNHLWRMLRPLQARANSLRIVTALQQLRSAKVSQFVNDDPKADLAAYGLAPASLDVSLGIGTNQLSAVHASKDTTNGLAFARREGLGTVVATPKEPLLLWRGTVNEFRDPNLLELTAPVAQIEVRGETPFTLQQRSSNVWAVAGEKFPVSTALVNSFIKTLSNLRISDFVKDTVTGPGWKDYGLDNPTNQITLCAAVGDTNSVIAQLLFGGFTTNEVFVKRADENFVYGLSLAEYGNLWLPADYFREPRVWSFAETNVAAVTMRQNGKTRQLLRAGTNDWSLAAGSQGIINPPAVEETLHRLSDLSAVGWVGRKFTDAEVGITTNSLSVTVELKSGDKFTVDFGKEVRVPDPTALAVVTLDGERWAFIFPSIICQYVAQYLTIPADSP